MKFGFHILKIFFKQVLFFLTISFTVYNNSEAIIGESTTIEDKLTKKWSVLQVFSFSEQP